MLKLHPNSLALLATYQADNTISAGPIAGPAGQVLVGTQNGTLYSLTGSLQKRWQRASGPGSRACRPTRSRRCTWYRNHYLKALDPYGGNLLWKRKLNDYISQGATAVGYWARAVHADHYGTIFAYGEGWSTQESAHATAKAVKIMTYGNSHPARMGRFAT